MVALAKLSKLPAGSRAVCAELGKHTVLPFSAGNVMRGGGDRPPFGHLASLQRLECFSRPVKSLTRNRQVCYSTSNVSATREVGQPSTLQNRVHPSVRARCHTRRIDSQQHEAETYHLIVDHHATLTFTFCALLRYSRRRWGHTCQPPRVLFPRGWSTRCHCRRWYDWSRRGSRSAKQARVSRAGALRCVARYRRWEWQRRRRSRQRAWTLVQLEVRMTH